MSRGIIYLITNKENGHKYVGQTILGMNKRWQQHIQEAIRMSDKPIHRAMRKYGNHNFMIKEIDECEESLLDEKEKYWINYYNTFANGEGYNTVIKEKPIQEIIIPEPITPSTKAKIEPWGTLTDKNRGDGKHCGLTIRGKNLETGLCTDYENARMASLSITGDPNKNGNILLAARNGGTAYGHKWQLLEDKKKKKAIFGVNKKTEQIEIRCESIADAIRQLGDGCKGAGLIKSLKNPARHSWKGYYWFYD
jgi:group I intron endonuclease